MNHLISTLTLGGQPREVLTPLWPFGSRGDLTHTNTHTLACSQTATLTVHSITDLVPSASTLHPIPFSLRCVCVLFAYRDIVLHPWTSDAVSFLSLFLTARICVSSVCVCVFVTESGWRWCDTLWHSRTSRNPTVFTVWLPSNIGSHMEPPRVYVLYETKSRGGGPGFLCIIWIIYLVNK